MAANRDRHRLLVQTPVQAQRRALRLDLPGPSEISDGARLSFSIGPGKLIGLSHHFGFDIDRGAVRQEFRRKDREIAADFKILYMDELAGRIQAERRDL